jgi:alkylation response protein AidB-like acyl-CoA dehydrogenase
MDFGFNEEQEAVFGLARKIFKDMVTPARLRQIEEAGDGIDRELWAALAKAGVLGTALPEDVGGMDSGLIALCQLMRAAGGGPAPVPLWPVLFLGAMPLAKFGADEQKRRWLPGVVAGEVLLSAALIEPGSDDPRAPETRATLNGGTWTLTGTKTCVPAAHLAERVLVPARFEAGVGLFWIDPGAEGVTLNRQTATSGEPQSHIELDGVVGELLGEAAQGVEILDWLVPRATVGLCAMQLGIAERVLRMTAKYTSQRTQFDRPIATFQAVSQRAGDAYIDVETIRLTTWQAAWRLESGEPAGDEVALAKLTAAEAGHRVAYAAQHLHGGIGFDLDYPLARYYTLTKTIELTLGSATRHLANLGRALAS